MNLNNFNLKLFTKTQLFLIFSYGVCWLSISTDFYDLFPTVNLKLLIFNFDIIYYKYLINFFRQFLNILIFPILLFIFFKNLNLMKIKYNLIFFTFLFYFLFQIPGLIIYENSIFNFVYIMSAVNVLMILQISNYHFKKDEYIIFIFVTFLMLVLITAFNYKTFVNFIYDINPAALYSFHTSSEFFLGKTSPRSTGSSRTFLFIFIILLILFKKNFDKNNLLRNILYVLIATIILMFQSRTTIVLLATFIILNFAYVNPRDFKAQIIYFVIHCIFPFILLFLIIFIKNLPTVSEHQSSYYLSEEYMSLMKNDFQRPINPNTYSSGRFEDWQTLSKKIVRSPLIGYGSQGDRFAIDQSASNGVLYALSSSGIFGFFFYFILTISSLILISKKIIFDTNKDYQNYLCATMCFIVILRSVLESSYAVFGVDFIVLSSLLFYLIKNQSKNDY